MKGLCGAGGWERRVVSHDPGPVTTSLFFYGVINYEDPSILGIVLKCRFAAIYSSVTVNTIKFIGFFWRQCASTLAVALVAL